MSYRINVPGLGMREAPDPRGLATAGDWEVFDALQTPSGFIDPVAFQVLVDRGLCVRGDSINDIRLRIQRKQ